MYSIEKKDYGLKLILTGFVEAGELKQWSIDMLAAMTAASAGFCAFVDMRDCQPLPQDTQQYMLESQKKSVELGIKRVAIILDDLITTLQFRRIGKQTGLYPQYERYISAEDEDWEQKAMDWILLGEDPDV